MAPNAADGYASDDECPTRPLPMLAPDVRGMDVQSSLKQLEHLTCRI